MRERHSPLTAVILGCGYTGSRVARLLAGRGLHVIATARDIARLEGLPARAVPLDITGGLRLDFVPEGALILHSIPSTDPDRTPALVAALASRPHRVVYLSTTGVYGDTVDVDENTPVAPRAAREAVRVEAEQAVASGPWQSLILRPAAIYGPGRGVHVSLRRGDFQLVGEGSNFVSRIHVDDLAEHACAALLSDLTGAYPVADEHPCTSREMADFCSTLLGVPLPDSVSAEEAHHTRRANRRVDGSAIRRLLQISLRFPSYRSGIPAALLEEDRLHLPSA